MRSVDKETRARIMDLQDLIRDSARAASEAHDVLLAKIAEAWPAFEGAVTAYNDNVQAYNEEIDQVVADIDAFMSEKSERWQQGEAAQAYEAWKADLEEKKIETIDDLEEPEIEMPNVIEPEELPGFTVADYQG